MTSVFLLKGQHSFVNFDVWEGQKTKVGSLVMDIYQDHKGYIWLSTFNGVIRFDGFEFTHLSELYPGFESIPSYHISCVRVDDQDRIWIGVIKNGLFMIDGAGELRNFNDLVSEQDQLQEYRIENIYFKDSRLFIVGRKGLNAYEKKGDGYVKIENFTGNDQNITSAIEYEGKLWFTTRTSLIFPKKLELAPQEFSRPYLFVDKSNGLWLSTLDESGTTLYRFQNGIWQKNANQPLKSIRKFRRYSWDYQHRLWGVAYIGDMIGYDFANQKWILEKNNSNTNLDQRNIRTILVDNSGSLWVGSNLISLYKSRPDLTSYMLPLGQNDDVKNCYQVDDSWIFSTGYEGLHLVNFKGQKTLQNTKNSELASNRMISFRAYENGKIGIHHAKGFQLMNEDKGLSSLVPFRGSNRSSCYHQGFYWVGGVNKIVRINPENLQSKVYNFDGEFEDQNIYFNGLAPKSEKELYVGLSLSDLYVFDIEEEKFVAEFIGLDNENRNNTCNDLAVSSSNNLAYGGQRGLFVYDGDIDENYISKRFINAVEWFNDTLLMASTNHEIYKINLNTKEKSVITQGDGLINSQFSLRSSFKTENDICFGGNRGLDCISAIDYKDSLPAILNIESISTSASNSIQIDENTDKVVLPMHALNVDIKLNHVYTKKQEEARVLYKNSNDEDWKVLSGNILTLSNLKSGNHSFEFMSDIPNYTGKIQSKKMSFVIPIPWYKKTWVHLLFAIAIMTFGFWIIASFKNREKEKELRSVQLKADIAELRLNALSSQMNPHFMFNALNSILQMINEEDIENASTYVQKFSRILRFVLEYAEQSWVPLDNEIDFLQDYLLLEQMRFNNSFDFTFDIEGKEKISNSSLPPFFIQPKIENALKHGIRGLFTRGEILVSIKIEDQFILVSVKDNGIGREASNSKNVFQQNHTNKGFELTRRRMDQLEKLGYESSLEIMDLYKGKDPVGTEIRMKLPRKTMNIAEAL